MSRLKKPMCSPLLPGSELCRRVDHVANETVLDGCLRVEPEVAVRVFFDALPRLPGGARGHAIEALAHLDDFAGFNVDIRRRAPGPAGRLMQQESRVRQAVALLERHGDVD